MLKARSISGSGMLPRRLHHGEDGLRGPGAAVDGGAEAFGEDAGDVFGEAAAGDVGHAFEGEIGVEEGADGGDVVGVGGEEDVGEGGAAEFFGAGSGIEACDVEEEFAGEGVAVGVEAGGVDGVEGVAGLDGAAGEEFGAVDEAGDEAYDVEVAGA